MGFRFSPRFVREVKEHFGSELSPRLKEALEEGDHEFVSTFLRGSRYPATWDMAFTKSYASFVVEARKQTDLKALCTRCDLEASRFRVGNDTLAWVM